MLGLCRHDYAGCPPRPWEIQLVLLIGGIPVEVSERKDIESHVDIANFLYFQDPPRGHPGPRTDWVEPEFSLRLLTHCAPPKRLSRSA